MSLTLTGDATNATLLSPAGMMGANDLLDLGLEPLVCLGDEEDANHVRAPFDPMIADR